MTHPVFGGSVNEGPRLGDRMPAQHHIRLMEILKTRPQRLKRGCKGDGWGDKILRSPKLVTRQMYCYSNSRMRLGES